MVSRGAACVPSSSKLISQCSMYGAHTLPSVKFDARERGCDEQKYLGGGEERNEVKCDGVHCKCRSEQWRRSKESGRGERNHSELLLSCTARSDELSSTVEMKSIRTCTEKCCHSAKYKDKIVGYCRRAGGEAEAAVKLRERTFTE
jgi:hypothetical protein